SDFFGVLVGVMGSGFLTWAAAAAAGTGARSFTGCAALACDPSDGGISGAAGGAATGDGSAARALAIGAPSALSPPAAVCAPATRGDEGLTTIRKPRNASSATPAPAPTAVQRFERCLEGGTSVVAVGIGVARTGWRHEIGRESRGSSCNETTDARGEAGS